MITPPSQETTSHGPRPGVLLASLPLLIAAIGAYLLAWAWRWPHGDMRDAWATTAGVLLLAGGAALLALWWASPRLHRAAAALSVALAVAGLVVLGVVSEQQQRVCGDVLRECGALLPGL